jgi:two-component system, cell cycle sensor histidine kinase and response regulator CckA
MVMPEMNGRDLAANLVALYPSLKCLFMSGYAASAAGSGSVSHARDLNSNINFLPKPFSHEELSAAIQKSLNRD